MKKNIALLTTVAVALALVTTGCAIVPSAAETAAAVQAGVNASVKFYEDNSFVVSDKETAFFSTLSNDMAIAMSVKTVAYNVRDIKTFSSRSEGSGKYQFDLITVNLKDGRTVSANVRDVDWWYCERGKGCSLKHPNERLVQYLYYNSLNGASPLQYYPNGLSQMRHLRLKPNVTVLTPEEMGQFYASVQRSKDRWAAGAPARAAATAAASAAARAKEERRTTALKTMKLGTTTMCSASYSARGYLDDSSSLECPGFGHSSIGEMLGFGWTIINTAPGSNGGTNLTFRKSL